MNILIGNSGNKIEVKFEHEYDIQIEKTLDKENTKKYIMKIFLLIPYKICICRLTAFTIFKNTTYDFQCVYVKNFKSYIIHTYYGAPCEITLGGGYEVELPVNKDVIKLMGKKIDELMFIVKRDIAIMMRFGNTFKYYGKDTFDSLFGHIP